MADRVEQGLKKGENATDIHYWTHSQILSGSLDGKLPLEMESPKLNYYFIPVIIITLR